MQIYAPNSCAGQKHRGRWRLISRRMFASTHLCSPFYVDLLMAKNGNLTSDLREAFSKISEVGRFLAPLTSRTSHEAPQLNRPTVNSEVSDPKSIAPSWNVNHELRKIFATPRRSNSSQFLSRNVLWSRNVNKRDIYLLLRFIAVARSIKQ